jgi:hypothetical protein
MLERLKQKVFQRSLKNSPVFQFFFLYKVWEVFFYYETNFNVVDNS